jgi:hypothetical protein
MMLYFKMIGIIVWNGAIILELGQNGKASQYNRKKELSLYCNSTVIVDLRMTSDLRANSYIIKKYGRSILKIFLLP